MIPNFHNKHAYNLISLIRKIFDNVYGHLKRFEHAKTKIETIYFTYFLV